MKRNNKVVVLDYCNGSSGGFDWVYPHDILWILTEEHEQQNLGFDTRVRSIEIPVDLCWEGITDWLEANVEMM